MSGGLKHHRLIRCCLLALALAVPAELAAEASPPALPQSEAQSDPEVAPAATPPNAGTESPAVDLSVAYTVDLWRNASGGMRRGSRYLDNLDVQLTVDAEQLIGWDGATAFLYGLYNNGNSLSDELVGDLQVVSNIEAGVRAARLFEAWIEQRFAQNRASLKIGLYDLNSEFDVTESGGLFLNNSHGIGPDFSQSGRNGPSIFPVTSLAVRADYEFSENWLLRAAVLDGVPGDPERPRRTAVRLGRGEGALLIAELQYSDARTRAAAGHWRYTAGFEDILATAIAGRAVTQTGNEGFYVIVERSITEQATAMPGLSAWIRLGAADNRFNSVESYLGGGLVYTGVLPGRPEDRLGLAIASARLGRPARRARELAGELIGSRETNIELTYRAVLTPWLTVQPDIQYVINPGASAALKNALVLGVRMEVGF